MKKNRLFWLFGSLLTLLVLGLVAQFVFALGRPTSAAKMDANVIPSELAGVEIKDLPIAATELVNAAVKETLDFSDYRYREYDHGSVSFTVYLAYWQDHKQQFMAIGTHAPDNCWVTNGWTMDPKLPKRAFQLATTDQLQVPSSNLSAQSSELKASSSKLKTQTWPAEMRVFHANDTTIYVAYWHLLAGQPLDYTHYGTGKTFAYMFDNIARFKQGTAEQYFLRISSPLPMDKLEQDSAFQQVLASLVEHIPLCPGGGLRR